MAGFGRACDAAGFRTRVVLWLAQSHKCMPVDLVYFLHKVAILGLNKQQGNNKGVFRQSISLVQIYVGL